MESFERGVLVKRLYDSGASLFTTRTLVSLFGVKKENTALVIIGRLVKIGILEKLEKGKYQLVSRPADTFSLAHFLYQPSYISLETALNLHGILSQFPYEITSVTTNKKREKIVADKPFVYLHLMPSLFWGYAKQDNALIAEPEKALLDMVYFVSKGERGVHLDELNLSRLNRRQINLYIKKYPRTRQFISGLKQLKKIL